jgi:hypothetical protein
MLKVVHVREGWRGARLLLLLLLLHAPKLLKRLRALLDAFLDVGV